MTNAGEKVILNKADLRNYAKEFLIIFLGINQSDDRLTLE